MEVIDRLYSLSQRGLSLTCDPMYAGSPKQGRPSLELSKYNTT